jgi:hypothetical protein
MMRVYSDPTRENDPHALPDVEIFEVDGGSHDGTLTPGMWYYWFCFPGCLPDSDPFGPYDTQAAAIAAVRDEWSE